MEAFWVATGIVALGEIGDKTQLLALVLTARFRRPLPIIAGILFATLANHTLAGVMGGMIRAIMPADLLRWLVALAFFAVALWALRPDQFEDEDAEPRSRWGIFGIVTAMFFAAEMGDKTQVATIVLAAQYPSLVAVILGTTLGMLLANVPVVLFGQAIADKVPLRWVRIAAAILFAVMGVYAIVGFELPAP
jgi:putative Ca2+/H+ antiporter (TMEM165/GDT1 family)